MTSHKSTFGYITCHHLVVLECIHRRRFLCVLRRVSFPSPSSFFGLGQVRVVRGANRTITNKVLDKASCYVFGRLTRMGHSIDINLLSESLGT